ncbi:MAG: hypothetical protein JO337_06860 [Acidimicrobiales bacterium]|nr:hypothetical protein [Acidimicrobiales bacterium]
MPLSSSIIRKALVTGSLVVGTSAGAAGIAAAATSSSSSTSSGSAPSSSSSTPSANAASSGAPSGTTGTAPADPATMIHGPNETLLTGTDQQKADAAATAAVPGATIIRAETDSSGAGTYEVHMKKADGSYVTVELDSSFKVIATVDGFGGGPAGGSGSAQAPGNAQAPSSGQIPSSSTSSSSTSA